MKTFKRWMVFCPNCTPSHAGLADSESGAWERLAYLLTGSLEVTTFEISHYKSIGYRAVRATITVEDE